MEKVNIKAQMLATLFLPTGAYAFWRINKMNQGTVIFISTGILATLGIIVSSLNYNTPYYWDGVLGFVSRYSSDSFSHVLLLSFTVLSSLVSIVIPMYYIRKWSIKYNART